MRIYWPNDDRGRPFFGMPLEPGKSINLEIGLGDVHERLRVRVVQRTDESYILSAEPWGVGEGLELFPEPDAPDMAADSLPLSD